MNNISELHDRGLVLLCPHCGRRNRLAYERLGQTFRCGNCHTELSPPGEPMEVKSEAVFDALAGHSALPVVVDFWAAWCGPCKMVAPELARVAAEGARQWLVVKVNTEELPGLAQRFRISGIPTLVEQNESAPGLPRPTVLHRWLHCIFLTQSARSHAWPIRLA